MTILNLTASGKAQELILAYLQENASDVLAEKINSGTPFTKDGKQLVNKKTLDGFMTFASGEAKKLAEKNARSACVEDTVVYGWAIHYFEEDSIEGKLFNEDGTEYKPVVKTTPRNTTKPVKVEPPKPKQQQESLFDMLSTTAKETITDQSNDHEPVEEANEEDDGDEVNADYTTEEMQELISEAYEQEKLNQPEPKKGSPFYQHYMNIQTKYSDCIIAYRLGDFYEVFGDNAVMIANELDLTLTGRDCGLEERVPMIGFPYHAAETYISKIVQHGHKIAIAEDLDTVHKVTPVLSDKVVDAETEEILDDEPLDEEHLRTSFDKETMLYLYDLLDGKMDIA